MQPNSDSAVLEEFDIDPLDEAHEDAQDDVCRAQALALEEVIDREAVSPSWYVGPTVSRHDEAVVGQVVADLLDEADKAGVTRSVRNQIWLAARQLGRIRGLVERLSDTKGDLFRVEADSWGYHVRTYRPLANHLRLMAAMTDRRIAELFPMCEMEPHVEVFLDCFTDLLGMPTPKQFATYARAEEVVARLNTGVQCLRNRVQSEPFQRKLDDLRRSIHKNGKSVRDYLDALFAVYAKLLVVRVDLSYKSREHQDDPRAAQEAMAQAIQDRALFIQRLKHHPIAEHLVGYIWKLEYGLYRGPHLHLMLIFNGQKARMDGVYARTAGELWVQVTQGRGEFYNCNAQKGRYGQALGIGMVTYDDAHKRARLQVAGAYLVEVDFVRRLNVGGAHRLLGRGEMPALDAVRKGRPRGKRAIGRHDALAQNMGVIESEERSTAWK